MQFTLNNDAPVQVSKPKLEGYKIHDVEFKGIEKADYKDGLYKVILIKFENEQGTHYETIFEPKEADTKRTTSPYGENPSRVEHLQRLFQIIVEEFNPDFFKNTQIPAKLSWDAMRDLFVNAALPGISKKIQIKLVKNNKGEAQFPGFFLSLTKDGAVKQTTTFIGKNLGWTPAETKKMNQVSSASPTKMKKEEIGDDLSAPLAPAPKAGLSLDDVGTLE